MSHRRSAKASWTLWILLAEKFVVRFIPKPYPCIRASTHLFNTEEELEGLTRTISKL